MKAKIEELQKAKDDHHEEGSIVKSKIAEIESKEQMFKLQEAQKKLQKSRKSVINLKGEFEELHKEEE